MKCLFLRKIKYFRGKKGIKKPLPMCIIYEKEKLDSLSVPHIMIIMAFFKIPQNIYIVSSYVHIYTSFILVILDLAICQMWNLELIVLYVPMS